MTQPAKIDMTETVRAELFLRTLARRRLDYFAQYTNNKYIMTPFHAVYSEILTCFAHGKIRNLITSMPPQHGKSLQSTINLPAYMLGLNPGLKAATVCYSTDKARRFGRQIKRLFNSPEYRRLFPEVRLPDLKDAGYTNSSDMVDIIGPDQVGSIIFTGRGGGITGEPLDLLDMDDLYKNAMEANSPLIRQNIIDWYNMAADSRLHNNSQQLITFTRWHDEDLVGYIQKTEGVELLSTREQLIDPDPDKWYMINFEALKDSDPTELDPRQAGEALFPQKHSAKKLNITKLRLLQGEPENWYGLYQGNPEPVSGLLYGPGFLEYSETPARRERLVYCDTADTGKDWLCAIAFDVGIDNLLYLVDVYYTPAPAEETEPAMVEFLIRNNVDRAIIESNAGGRAFARNVERILKEQGGTTLIEPVPQMQNKESRILSGAASVMRVFRMPLNWTGSFPAFAGDLLRFKKLFGANTRDDAPDTLQGCYERSGVDGGQEIYIVEV